jgi:YidC/Oxa1 family membrane protein insertase
MELYKQRGVNPASGCLPALLTLVLLIPMYSVFSQGLTAPDISSMLRIFGVQVIDIACQAPGTTQPCIDPTVHWLPDPSTGGLLQANRPEIIYTIPGINFGLSLLALISALLQLIQTRMMTPRTTDPSALAQQRAFLILPIFSIFYGSFLPAGLFIYWIVTTIFSIVQQYLIAGWGSLFPLFGWTPAFARDHQPRFAVALPSSSSPPTGDDDRKRPAPARDRRSPADRAAGTVRPSRQKGRTSRRGRRR